MRLPPSREDCVSLPAYIREVVPYDSHDRYPKIHEDLSESDEDLSEDCELVAISLEGGTFLHDQVSIEGECEVMVCVGDAGGVWEDVGEAVDCIGEYE